MRLCRTAKRSHSDMLTLLRSTGSEDLTRHLQMSSAAQLPRLARLSRGFVADQRYEKAVAWHDVQARRAKGNWPIVCGLRTCISFLRSVLRILHFHYKRIANSPRAQL